MRDPLKSLPGNDRGRSRNHQMYYNAILLFTTCFMIKGKFENFALFPRASGFINKLCYALLRSLKKKRLLGHILLYSLFLVNYILNQTPHLQLM